MPAEKHSKKDPQKKAKTATQAVEKKQAKTKTKKHKAVKPKSGKPEGVQLRAEGTAEILNSQVVYEGPLFKVLKEEIREPNGNTASRDIIRHNGSVVILAVDSSGKKGRTDPLVIMERQYRHAAGQYLWEIPAGKIETGEERLAGGKRELAEETGYSAKKWTELIRYFASPGFLGEWMQVYLAEDLERGRATPEEDETLEIYPLRLSAVEALIAAGEVLDGKTLVAISMYRQIRGARKNTKKKKA